MNKNKILQKDYTLSSLYYQIKLPLDLEILIPADDPVRLQSAFVEGMELSDLYKTYGKIKKNQASPRQLFKIIIYASMNRIYSSRDIETACHRDIANVKEDMNFRRYLYRGKENVTAQSVILAIGYNINKLHHKIQNGRTGQHLFALKK